MIHPDYIQYDEYIKSQAATHIWGSTVDNGQFYCSVERLTERTGMLRVHEGAKVLLEQEVSLSYGAQFGPDMDDVAHWQSMCLKVIDGE